MEGCQRVWKCYCAKAMVVRQSDSNSVPYDELRNIKHDIAYLSDVFTKFNEVNLQLQENYVNLIKVKSAISTFLSKLQLFK